MVIDEGVVEGGSLIVVAYGGGLRETKRTQAREIREASGEKESTEEREMNKNKSKNF